MSATEPGTDRGDFSIRAASEADIAILLQLIRELAEYERLLPAVVATEADLRAALFGPQPCAEAILAECDGQPAGFALFFTSYSTFVGRPGIYLEDIFVRPRSAAAGWARPCFSTSPGWLSSGIAAGSNGRCSTGTSRRSSSIAASSATALSEWTVFRLAGAELRSAAGKSEQNSP